MLPCAELDTLGACVACGRAIALPRLLAQPTAVRCIACQNAIEHAPGAAGASAARATPRP